CPCLKYLYEYINGKAIGIIYLAIAMLCVAMVISYIRIDILGKGMDYWDLVKAFCVLIFILIFQFARWFFYSFYTDDKVITIKKLGRCIEFEKTAVTSVYSIDFIGTIIEYDDKKVIIPTGKRSFYENLSESGIGFSADVFFARMRKMGHITVRPKWYALLIRFFLFALAFLFFIGGIIGIRQEIAKPHTDFLYLLLIFLYLILSVYIMWWFNRSFVYISEDYIWQGLFFPRKRYSWKEFDRAELKRSHHRGVCIDILKLYFKDSKKKISISVEDDVLNTEDLFYLLKTNGISIK
ncbi:MAG: hypothetical protein K5900_06770, partial [Butyrivibrio sp.]|nr:hypothetical protein [Butyrivibrio sp.]